MKSPYAKFASLISKLQDRLTKTTAAAHQNAASILILADKQKGNDSNIELLLENGCLLSDEIDAIKTRIEEQGQISTGNDCQLSDKVEANRAQTFQRTEALGLQIAKVKEENDLRETQQDYRDRNNVQSLINLRDSAQKALTEVQTDLKNLV